MNTVSTTICIEGPSESNRESNHKPTAPASLPDDVVCALENDEDDSSFIISCDDGLNPKKDPMSVSRSGSTITVGQLQHCVSFFLCVYEY